MYLAAAALALRAAPPLEAAAASLHLASAATPAAHDAAEGRVPADADDADAAGGSTTLAQPPHWRFIEKIVLDVISN